MKKSTQIALYSGAGVICLILGATAAITFANFMMSLSGIIMGISCLWRAFAVKNDKDQTYPAILLLVGIIVQSTYIFFNSNK